MQMDHVLLKCVMDLLNLPTDLTSFSDRLCLQKYVYLAQICGVDLGYRFSWYLRGPYCTALTSDAFQLRDDEKLAPEFFSKYHLSAEIHNSV